MHFDIANIVSNVNPLYRRQKDAALTRYERALLPAISTIVRIRGRGIRLHTVGASQCIVGTFGPVRDSDQVCGLGPSLVTHSGVIRCVKPLHTLMTLASCSLRAFNWVRPQVDKSMRGLSPQYIPNTTLRRLLDRTLLLRPRHVSQFPTKRWQLELDVPLFHLLK